MKTKYTLQRTVPLPLFSPIGFDRKLLVSFHKLMTAAALRKSPVGRANSYFAALIMLAVCGCEGGSFKQIPTTILPSPDIKMVQQKDQQHLQGSSLNADRQEAVVMNDRLLEVPECRNYTYEILGKLNNAAFTNCPVGTTFYLRLEIYQDGSIGNVAVNGWTNAIHVPLYIRDIKKSQFPKWPETMRNIVGKDYFIMWINTGMPNQPDLN
ncbi:MAG TPA: hypothetical protein VGI03_11050 [Verrucomicrobiae bacterium]